MLHYFALYVRDIEYHPDQEPTGLIVKGPGTRESLMYDHRAGGWRYRPDAVSQIMNSLSWDDRRRQIDRTEAEAIALRISQGTGPLPSEAEIGEIFAESHL